MGNGKIWGALSIICLMLDKELQVDQCVACFWKATKVLQEVPEESSLHNCHPIALSISKYFKGNMNAKKTCINKPGDIKHTFKSIVSLMKRVDTEAKQMANNSKVKEKLLNSVMVDEEEWKRGNTKGRL